MGFPDEVGGNAAAPSDAPVAVETVETGNAATPSPSGTAPNGTTPAATAAPANKVSQIGDDQEIEIDGKRVKIADLRKSYGLAARYPKMRDSFNRRGQELNQAKTQAEQFRRLQAIVNSDPALARALAEKIAQANGQAARDPQASPSGGVDQAAIRKMIAEGTAEQLEAAGLNASVRTQMTAMREIEAWESQHGEKLSDAEIAQIGQDAHTALEEAAELEEPLTLKEAIKGAMFRFTSSAYAKARAAARTPVTVKSPQAKGTAGAPPDTASKSGQPKPGASDAEWSEYLNRVARAAAR